MFLCFAISTSFQQQVFCHKLHLDQLLDKLFSLHFPHPFLVLPVGAPRPPEGPSLHSQLHPNRFLTTYLLFFLSLKWHFLRTMQIPFLGWKPAQMQGLAGDVLVILLLCAALPHTDAESMCRWLSPFSLVLEPRLRPSLLSIHKFLSFSLKIDFSLANTDPAYGLSGISYGG